MEITTGLIVVIVAMAFFYLRIALLRGKKKRYYRENALKRRKVNGRSKGSALPAPEKGAPPFGVSSWLLVVIAVLLMIAGVIMYNDFFIFGTQIFKDSPDILKYAEYWYILVALGVIALAFCFKIQKPLEDE
jgi:hypothetical protein